MSDPISIRDFLTEGARRAEDHVRDILNVLGAREIAQSVLLAAIETGPPVPGELPGDYEPGKAIGHLEAVDGASPEAPNPLAGFALTDSDDLTNRILEDLKRLAPESEHWVGAPVYHRLQDRHVFVVGILRATGASQYVRWSVDRAPRSLLEHTVMSALYQCAERLESVVETTPAEHVRRSAGQLLGQWIDSNPFHHPFQAPTGRDTFADLTAIAAERYEGKGANGQIVVSGERDPPPTFVVQLARPVGLSSHRQARKLLELSQLPKTLCLRKNAIVGLLSCPSPDQFLVRFRPNGVWELRYGEIPLMTVRRGQAHLPDPLAVRDAGPRALSLDFPSFTSPMVLRQAVDALADAGSHGASIVVIDDAQNEANRLHGQATVLEQPVPISDDLLRTLTAVDGALLIDGQGMIHAFGAILDGAAGEPTGSQARGSRYNSAFNYVRARVGESDSHVKRTTTAIVVSMDGTVDWITRTTIHCARLEQERARQPRRLWPTAPTQQATRQQSAKDS